MPKKYLLIAALFLYIAAFIKVHPDTVNHMLQYLFIYTNNNCPFINSNSNLLSRTCNS